MPNIRTMQGLTPTIIVRETAVDLTEAAHLYPSIKQGSFVLRPESFEVSANEVDIYLSQADTLQLSPGSAEIQINWTYADGQRGAIYPKPISIGANHLPEELE